MTYSRKELYPCRALHIWIGSIGSKVSRYRIFSLKFCKERRQIRSFCAKFLYFEVEQAFPSVPSHFNCDKNISFA